MKFTLEVQNKEGKTLASAEGENRLVLVYPAQYEEGDNLIIKTSEPKAYVILQLDDAMGEEFVYCKEKEYCFHIPFAEKKTSYSPKTFAGSMHVLTVRCATKAEISAQKNLARNRYDQHENSSCFPHACANVETRGEAVFAARNAINGNCCNLSHGPWPYESWGINMQDDAEITIDFGRTVEIDRMVLVTRADFPHDNYWQQVTFTFSDGSQMVQALEKSIAPHEIPLCEKKKVQWIKLGNLLKDPNDPSPFPALTQWEVYGTEAE